MQENDMETAQTPAGASVATTKPRCTDVVLFNGTLVAAYPLPAVSGVSLGVNVFDVNGLVDKTQPNDCARIRHFGERTSLFAGVVDPMQFNVKTHAVLRVTRVHSACHVTSFKQVCIDMACYGLDTPRDITLFQFEYGGVVFGDLRTVRHWDSLYREFRKYALMWKSEPDAVWIVRTAVPTELVSVFANTSINEPVH